LYGTSMGAECTLEIKAASVPAAMAAVAMIGKSCLAFARQRELFTSGCMDIVLFYCCSPNFRYFVVSHYTSLSFEAFCNDVVNMKVWRILRYRDIFVFFSSFRGWRLDSQEALVKARIALLHSRLNLFLAQLVLRISASVIRPRGITAKASTSTTFQSRKRPYTSRLSALRSPAASTSLHSRGSQRRCRDCQRASGSMGRRVMAAKRTRDAWGILASICSNLIRPIRACTVSQRMAECKAVFNFGVPGVSGAGA
jgi:hypothetical protein